MSTRYQGSEEEIRALDTYIKLMRATGSVTCRAHTHLMEEKLTISQFGVLEALFHLGPLVQRDLANKLLVTAGNITMVVGNLKKRGLVLRKRDNDDRRFITVYLTARGNDLIGRIFPIHVDAIRREFSALTADEQDVLGNLCKKLGIKET